MKNVSLDISESDRLGSGDVDEKLILPRSMPIL